MFNYKNYRTAQVKPYEKYLREDSIEPDADDAQLITEKELTDRTGDENRVTEKQMKEQNKTAADDHEFQVIEKILNKVTNLYNPTRSAEEKFVVPAINKEVAEIEQKRMDQEWKTDQSDHWSVKFDDQKQNGSLPEWPKNPDEKHENIFESKGYQIDLTSKDVAIANKVTDNLTTADVDRIAHGIKTGASMDYDTAIVAILRQAHQENRELTPIEQKTVSNLKVSRTNFLFSKNA